MSTRVGGYRGSRGGSLSVPPGARPTSARVRKAIFDILGQSCEGDRVLDLFAGSGSLGIEAAARGAASVVFVERDPVAAEAVRDNVRRRVSGCDVRVLQMDVQQALEQLQGEGARFDLVLADPPYDRGDTEPVLNALDNRAILGPAAVVVLEHSLRESTPDRCGGLLRTDQRRYGQTNVSFYEERAE